VAMQRAIESGHRSLRIDADDLIEVLLSIADRLVPPLAGLVTPATACPHCGERDVDRLVLQVDEETVKCTRCGTTFRPSE